METKIDYLDRCINIICGCTARCAYCWARNRYAPRFAHRCKLCGQFKPHFHEERLKQIGKINAPAIVGLNFMGDTWDKNVKRVWRNDIWNAISPPLTINIPIKDQTQYIVLTKQPQNIKDFALLKDDKPYEADDVIPNNLWVGVSIESIDHIDRWIALSQKEYIAHKIISFEPFLTYYAIDVFKYYFRIYGMPDWIILGALTKSDKKSMADSRKQSKRFLNYLLTIKDRPPIFVKDNCEIKGAPKEFPAELKH